VCARISINPRLFAEEIDFLKNFLQLWKLRKLTIAKKLQIISEESAQNAFVNQADF
jgi:hypothetical protein